MKTQNIFLTSITAIALIVPALADPVTPNIAVGTNPADCTEPVLGTTSGTSNLQANWSANTLNLQWTAPDADNWSAQNNTCTYDSGITVPSTNPTKTGYTFAGWRVVSAAAPQQTTITLSSLYASGTINTLSSKSLTQGAYCEGKENGDWYGNDEGGSCSDSRFSGLNNGEWVVTMPNGNIVKGVATCSTQSGNNHSGQWGGNSADWSLASDALQAGQYSTDNSSGMRHCWCKSTSADTGSGFQTVASSSWVFHGSVNADECALSCAFACVNDVRSDDDFRRAVFGVTQ